VLVQALLVLVALAGSGLAARYFFKAQFIHQVSSQLKDSLLNLSHKLPDPIGSDWCTNSAIGAEFRLTVLGADGKVVCDSRGLEIDATLPSRPEIVSARAHGFGEAVRHSNYFRDEEFLGALLIPGRGVVIRGAVPLSRLSQTMRVVDTSLGLVLIIIALTLVACAIYSARRLVFPLGRLLLKTQGGGDAFSENAVAGDLTREWFDEWSELESNIDHMRRDLMAKTQSLSMEQVELDTIMGAISDAILAVDPEGNPLFYNSRFELLFGGEGLRKRNIKLWAIFRDPEILSAFRAALKDGQRAATKAIPLEQKEGLKSFFSLSVSPLRKSEGTIYGAVGIFHDVTELKSAEQMRIDFVANVSHELRTPLTSIKGYVDTLIDDVNHQKPIMPEFLQIIARNTERLLNLMNDLLDLSSIESADILQKDPLSTLDLTERIVKQMQVGFESKGQTVEWEIKATTVVADTQRIEQVLSNLLINANKYTPSGSRITVIWESQGRDVLLKVKDTGPGIPVEHHSRLFERFYRVDKARAREQGGTGLGLAIVKHIMQRHEGSIWVESKPGEGAVFICRFPAPTTS